MYYTSGRHVKSSRPTAGAGERGCYVKPAHIILQFLGTRHLCGVGISMILKDLALRVSMD